MSKEEIWKVVPGYSRYEASNLGRIRRLSDGCVIKPLLSGIPQYYYVNATPDGGKNNIRRVHILVAKAFIDNPENLPVVDHINRDKLDNRVNNLRWVTRSGNGRNQENNIYVDYENSKVLLVELVENLFGKQDDQKIYLFLSGRLQKGEDIQTALLEFDRYNQVGLKLKKIEYKGQQIFLKKLCDIKGYNYNECSSRLNRGWTDWNVAYNINPLTQGVEVKFGNVNIWFADEISAQAEFNVGPTTLENLIAKGFNFKDIGSYDRYETSRESFRKEVLGVKGTVAELAEHFGKTFSCVQSRMKKGMTLQEALTTPIQRLKFVTINGERKTLKAWYEYFNLPDDRVRNWRDNNRGISFTQTLENFGVSTSELKILEG